MPVQSDPAYCSWNEEQPALHMPDTGHFSSPGAVTDALDNSQLKGRDPKTNSGTSKASVTHHKTPSNRDNHHTNNSHKDQNMEGTIPCRTDDANIITQIHPSCPPRHSDDPFYPNFDPVAVEEHSQRIASYWPHPTAQAMEEFPDFCKIYSVIKSFNLPNVLGARLTLKSGLNLDNWERLLQHYHDKEICAFLRYGWPLGYSNPEPPISVDTNHPSGRNHMDHVSTFIRTELQHQAIVGPFKDPPFFPWTRNNPIMSRPKKDSHQRRIIIDLTYPQDGSVNQGIDIHSILGRDISYTLPNIWDLTTHLQTLGAGGWVWKADLQRAYRQLRVDPPRHASGGQSLC